MTLEQSLKEVQKQAAWVSVERDPGRRTACSKALKRGQDWLV